MQLARARSARKMLWAPTAIILAAILGGARLPPPASARAMRITLAAEPATHMRGSRLQRLRRFRRASREAAAPVEETAREGVVPPSATNNGTVEALVLSVPSAMLPEYMAVGCNASVAAAWLRYELSEAVQAELIEAAHAEGAREGIEASREPMDAQRAILQLLRREELTLGDRPSHRRIGRLWRAGRLLLRGVRLSDLAHRGRLHAAALASTHPARSRRLTERAFRREVMAQMRRTRQLRPSKAEATKLVSYVRVRSGIDVARLRGPGAKPAVRSRFASGAAAPAASSASSGALARGGGEAEGEPPAAAEAADMAAWCELLTWFREHFPYNRAQCACGAHGELIGNVRANAREREGRAMRTELQWCGASGVMQRFPRYNDVATILTTRKGRCGEYSQVLYQLVRALGWPARLVVDWTDHMWVEVRLPMQGEGAPAGEAPSGAQSGPSPGAPGGAEPTGAPPVTRWVHLDPCEAAVDQPSLYAEWGKTLTYVLAIGDGRLVDVTSTYAGDLNATMHARDLDALELRRALRWARLACKPAV